MLQSICFVKPFFVVACCLFFSFSLSFLANSRACYMLVMVILLFRNGFIDPFPIVFFYFFWAISQNKCAHILWKWSFYIFSTTFVFFSKCWGGIWDGQFRVLSMLNLICLLKSGFLVVYTVLFAFLSR